jgi:hypothetical protein
MNALSIAVYTAINGQIKTIDKTYKKYRIKIDIENKNVQEFKGIDKNGNITDITDLYKSNFEDDKTRYDILIEHLKNKKLPYGKFIVLEVSLNNVIFYTKINGEKITYSL